VLASRGITMPEGVDHFPTQISRPARPGLASQPPATGQSWTGPRGTLRGPPGLRCGTAGGKDGRLVNSRRLGYLICADAGDARVHRWAYQ
jgi:hypothetical protein